MLDLENAEEYIKDSFNDTGDSSWLEGWIHGYTDPDHKYENTDEAKERLMDYIRMLREN